MIKKTINNILELVFPANCFGCGVEETWLCEKCLDSIPIHNTDKCQLCNKVILKDLICSSCKKESGLDSFISVTNYENKIFQELLHNLKYNFASNITEPFEKILNCFLNQNPQIMLNRNSILVPIPLHKRRLAERGFNQSELIGNMLSRLLKINMDTTLLIRKKNTKSQMTLNRKERLTNLKDSFLCPKPDKIFNKNIILIDDVLTTGSTIKEASTVLKKARCNTIGTLVLAKGGLINIEDNGRIN